MGKGVFGKAHRTEGHIGLFDIGADLLAVLDVFEGDDSLMILFYLNHIQS